MFDRGKPKEATSPKSPDRKMSPTQGRYMNNEQFCLSPPLYTHLPPYSGLLHSFDAHSRLYLDKILTIVCFLSHSCIPPRSSQQPRQQAWWCEATTSLCFFSRVPPWLFPPVLRWPPFTG